MSLDVIADIKDGLPMPEFVQREGVVLKREGRVWTGCCPFHTEKTGSFKVWEDHYKCFGCGESGDILTFVQKTRNVDFKDALRELAREAGIELRQTPEQQAEAKRLRERAEVLTAAAEHYHSLLRPEHREYLHKRGFTDEFIDSFGFGFAPGGTIRQLSADPALLKEIGLLNDQGRDFYYRRIIIPVYGRDKSAVINLVGRRWVDPGEEDTGPRKFVRLPGDEQIINEWGLRGAKFVYIAEGDTDTPTLVQAGLPAIGLPGASALKEEWIEKIARVDTVYVCADADKAGDGLIRRCGEAFGPKARIVRLPTGLDVNDYVGKQGQDITKLAAEAATYLEWLVSRLPATIKPADVDSLLGPIVGALRRYSRGGQDAYIKGIARRFGITAESLREVVREQEQKAKQNGNGANLSSTNILWKMPTLLNPSQDLVGDVMLTTVFLDVVVEDPETKTARTETVPYVVTSRRECFPLTAAEMWARGWQFAESKVPALGVVGRRWSVASDAPHSVKSYLDKQVNVSAWQVHQEVARYFRRFVEYKEDWHYDFMALWTEATYFFNLYSAFPYLHLFGFKRTGKSRTLSIIDQLAFNALWSASMSAAASYRAIESCSATLLIDEAEHLQKPKKDAKNDSGKDDDKLEILKAGYQKGQKAIRCEGDKHEPKGFDLYSPKAFGGTQAVDRILGDRIIQIVLVRREKDLEEYAVTDQAVSFAATRDKLYVMMLDYGALVAEEIRSGIQWNGVKDRDKELWTPILTLAQVIDQSRLEEENVEDPAQLLTFRMRQAATQNVQQRIERERAEQAEVVLIEALIKYTKLRTSINPRHPHAYPFKNVYEYIRQFDELKWIEKPGTLVGQMEKMALVTDRERDLPKLHTSTTNANSSKPRCIILDPDRLASLANRYGASLDPEDIGGFGEVN